MRIKKYCNNGSVYSECFTGNALYVIHVESNAVPSPLFHMKHQLSTYLSIHKQETMTASDSMAIALPPLTYEEWCNSYPVAYQWCSRATDDADGVGWAKAASAFYVSGGAANIKDFLMFMDDLMAWRSTYSDVKLDAISRKPDVHVYLECDLRVDIQEAKNETKCMFAVSTTPPTPASVFHVPPPIYPARIVVLTFELASVDVVHLIFSGNTRPFQKFFAKLGIPGQTIKVDPEAEFGEYFRVMQTVSIANAHQAATTIKDILGDKCLQQSPVILRAKETDQDVAMLASLVRELKVCENTRIEIEF